MTDVKQSENATARVRAMIRRHARKHQGGGRGVWEGERLLVAGLWYPLKPAVARLFKAYEDAIHAQLGGLEALDVGQVMLARRAAFLAVRLEVLERRALDGERFNESAYLRMHGALARTLSALGVRAPAEIDRNEGGDEADEHTAMLLGERPVQPVARKRGRTRKDGASD